MADDINTRLSAYGQWLDEASQEYLQEKELGTVFPGVGKSGRSGRVSRLVIAAAATAALVAGSFVVNGVVGSSRSRDVAFAWGTEAVDATDSQRQAVVDACTLAKPDINETADTEVAVSIQGSLGFGVYVKDPNVTVCVADINRDTPEARVLDGFALGQSASQSGAADVVGVQVATMRLSGHEITVIWGRDNEIPLGCRNLDVYSSKGVIRALRSHGVFAFWYPGPPAISGMKANSIQYGCAADDSASGTTGSTASTIAGGDPFASLCAETMTVLRRKGIINPSGNVLDLGKWDTDVYMEFSRRLSKIAEVFTPGPNIGLTDIYAAWTGLNEGNMLALDSSGAQVITDRPAVEAEVTSAIHRFVAVCQGSLVPPSQRPDAGVQTTTNPIGGMSPVTPTTIQVREMNPVTRTTVLAG